MARTDIYTSHYYGRLTTFSVTTDLSSKIPGTWADTYAPKNAGKNSRPEGRVARAIQCLDVTDGTTIEVVRPDGDHIVLDVVATQGTKYEVQIKKILPTTTVTALLIEY